MVPVGVVHVGCPALSTGTAGAFGTALMVVDAVLVQVLSPAFLTFTVCDPGTRPLHPFAGYGPKVPLSNWYSTPLTAVSVMVPVGVVHVGCPALSTGTA